MNTTLRNLELTQELHQLLEFPLNSDSVTRYHEIKCELAKLTQLCKPFFNFNEVHQ